MAVSLEEMKTILGWIPVEDDNLIKHPWSSLQKKIVSCYCKKNEEEIIRENLENIRCIVLYGLPIFMNIGEEAGPTPTITLRSMLFGVRAILMKVSLLNERITIEKANWRIK